MRRNGFVILATAAATSIALASCSSTGSHAATSSAAKPSVRSVSPQLEVNPPGDIPDNQAFVAFHTSAFTVTVPEGWTRTARNGDTVFTDKYNSITAASVSAATAPTVSSARSTELPAIRSSAKGDVPGSVTTVQRTAGPAVLITYQAQSPVNAVTGKFAMQAVERYEFWRAGREVVLTLAAPVGSDNVDPWRIVTQSFAWSGR